MISVSDKLNNLDKEDLINLILKLTEVDNANIETVKEFVKNTDLNKINYSYGDKIYPLMPEYYLNYGEAEDFADRIWPYLFDAEEFIKEKNYSEAISIYIALVENLLDNYEKIEDQEGFIDALFHEISKSCIIIFDKISDERLRYEIIDMILNIVDKGFEFSYISEGIDINFYKLLNNDEKDSIIADLENKKTQYMKDEYVINEISLIITYLNSENEK